jgi:hypothetical protein
VILPPIVFLAPHPEPYRVAFVEKPELSVGHGGIVRVQEDPAVHQRPVKVGYERPDVSGKRNLFLHEALSSPGKGG